MGDLDVAQRVPLRQALARDRRTPTGREFRPRADPGGLPEYLSPDPLEQLAHIETGPVRLPY
jgi:hypothetical protein